MSTRRQLLIVGAGLALRPTSAFADSADAPTLTALVAYEQEVVFGYDVTLAKAPLAPGDRATFTRFRHEAATAVAALRSALRQAGGTPPVPPDPKTAPPPADPSRAGYLRDVITVEEAAVARYYEAFQELTDERHIKGSAAFMAESGRRLVVLRSLVGAPLLPRAFETGGA
jgi:hypothetical protein